jgi:hypothetical protein
MCIIAVCKTKPLTKVLFNNCWESNGHGMGIAWYDGKNVSFHKGIMGKKKAWDLYKTIPAPHVVHFRIASVGGVCPELTHPFLITKRSPLHLEWTGQSPVLFHNGSLGDWQDLLRNCIFTNKIVPKGKLSDSRVMAMSVATVGEDLLGMYTGHRWVIITKDGIRTWGDWDEEDEISYSNTGYKPTVRYVRYPALSVDDDVVDERNLADVDDYPEFFPRVNATLPLAYKNKSFDYDCTSCQRREGRFCHALGKRLINDNPCTQYLPDATGSESKKAHLTERGWYHSV